MEIVLFYLHEIIVCLLTAHQHADHTLLAVSVVKEVTLTLNLKSKCLHTED